VDERAVVSEVVDGDTLRLTDGRLVRFIGINTPELGRDDKPAEPLAAEARAALLGLLPPGAAVGLRYGSEHLDRYQRTLAHVYTAAGLSVEAKLLAAGLAAHIVVPPNVWQWQCYRETEAEARAAGIGVWAGIYRPIHADELARETSGFRIVTGRIERVGESKRSLWLNFSRRPGEGPREGVALRIDRDDLGNFDSWNPHDLQRREVVARGWFYPHQGQAVLRVRHPAALEIVPGKNEH
jgi:endonuclease YncB( thermonuclease family)